MKRQSFFVVCDAVLLAVFLNASAIAADQAAESADPGPSQAERLVRTALLFDLEGDRHCRDLTLQLALRKDPDCESAHWGLGQVQVNGKWYSYRDVTADSWPAPDFQEYRRMRDEALAAPSQLLRLARWCHKRGWQDAERLYLHLVLSTPGVDDDATQEAVRKLELVRIDNRYVTKTELQQIRQEEQRLQAADKIWMPRVKKWREQLQSNQLAKRKRALAELQKVDDPGAIPALEAVLSVVSEPLARQVVTIIGKMTDIAATESLVRHAVGAPWPHVRALAMNHLAERPRHDYFPMLLYGLVSPIKTRFSVAMSPNGTVHYDHTMFREGPTANLETRRTAVTRPYIISQPSTKTTIDGVTHVVRGYGWQDGRHEQLREANRAMRRAMQAEQQLLAANQQIADDNARVFEVLERTSGQVLDRSAPTWWEWWQEYNDVETGPKPTIARRYGASYEYLSDIRPIRPFEIPVTCFPAGTQVWTDQGPADIRTIQIGDRVLSQDVDTGELAYKLVVNTTVRPIVRLRKMLVGDTEVTCTVGHPMWMVSEGWRMAKRLKVGERLCTLNGARVVGQISDAPLNDAYNLVIDGFHTYFVTDDALLVHDSEYRRPTRALIPGLLAEHRK